MGQVDFSWYYHFAHIFSYKMLETCFFIIMCMPMATIHIKYVSNKLYSLINIVCVCVGGRYLQM